MKKRLDRFVLQDVIAESESGVLYRAAEQLPWGLTRTVVLWQLPPVGSDSRSQARSTEQMKMYLDLAGQPNFAAVYCMGLTDSIPWIATEWLESPLKMAIRDMPTAPEYVRAMLKQMAAALDALHSLTPPMLHNNLTPETIAFDKLGTYKLTDLTVAGPITDHPTRVNTTVRYAAPEVFSNDFGAISPATDLYALGHIAYEMALGGKLYRAQFPAVYEQHRMTSDQGSMQKWMSWHCSIETRPANLIDLLPEMPEYLSTIIARLMRKNAAERYPSAKAMLADLRSGATASTATPAQAATPQTAQSPRHKPAVAAVAPSPEASASSEGAPPVTAPTNAAESDRYYVRLGPQTTGPFEVAVLKNLIRQGKISRLHKVSTDRVNWKSVSSIEGLN